VKFIATFEKDEDGWWIAECPALPGCVSQGRTLDEAKANIREAIELCVETRLELGMPLTCEVAEIEVPTPVG